MLCRGRHDNWLLLNPPLLHHLILVGRLDNILLHDAVEELGRDVVLGREALRDIEYSLGLEVKHLPDGAVLQQLFGAVAGFDDEVVTDELEFLAGRDGFAKSETVELQVAR